TSDQCRVHSLNYHASTFAVTVLTKSGSSKQVTVTQIDDVYPCPFCSVVFKTKGGCRKHLNTLTCAPEEQDNDEPTTSHRHAELPVSPHGAEQNGLAHISVIAKLSDGEGQVAPNMPPPKKRKHAHHDACPICTPTPAPGLEYVLSISPYAASIQRRKYTELDNG
ncbi:hypothetical protein BGZ95_007117, partial [Linnemannia exigua]